MATWKATNDRVVVQTKERPQQTETGIILAGKAKAQSEAGTVLAVGSDVTGVKVGDGVIYEAKFAVAVAGGIVSVQGQDILAGVADE